MDRFLSLVFPLAFLTACATAEDDDLSLEPPVEELSIGEIDDMKADGNWGAALTCKPIPDLPKLVSPRAVVSLDGLTLHLWDEAGDYDKVFPIGPGKIENGVSLTPTSLTAPSGVFYMRLDQPEATEGKTPGDYWAWNFACKYWYKDKDLGKYVPVFAGLPFIRLQGPQPAAYGIHGPIDSYTLPNGGRLKRGFVSHGCIRMEAADLLEVYARCRGKKVPVRVQKALERRADGTAVDLAQRWLLSECKSDADCNFTGGKCLFNEYAVTGWCGAPCTKYCSLDKWGYPESFCVADPSDDQKGVCTLKSSSLNNYCRRYPGFALDAGVPRFSQPAVKADVCLPGSKGWIGDPCFTDADCGLSKGRCELSGSDESRPGFCTQGCTKTCPDLAGNAGTFCVSIGTGGECVAKCAIEDDCGAGFTCKSGVPRFGQPSAKASVCL